MRKKHLLAVGCITLLAGAFVGSATLAQNTTPPIPTSKDAAKDAVNKAKKDAKDAGNKAKDDLKNAAPSGMSGMDPKMMEGMQAMMKAGQPGPMQAMLKKSEGEWDLDMKSTMSPDMPMQSEKMHSKAAMIMDGRYLEEQVWGEFDMGGGPQKFSGRSVVGYDNAAKQFQTTWIDSMSTGMMTEKGSYDEASKTMTCEGDYYCPMYSKMCHSKTTMQWKDDNTRLMQMWAEGPDGKMFKNMEITYTRKK